MIQRFHPNIAGRFLAPAMCLLFVLFLLPSTVAGQVRPRRDTTVVRPDTLARDTLVRDTLDFAQDSVQPARVLVQHARGPEPSFATAVWEWDREALLRESALTLFDLLRRVPGLLAFRAGYVLQPEVASVYGTTRNGYEVILDGYFLDPIVEPTYDLSRIELVELNHVRVVRRLDVTRIELQTYASTLGVAESRVEAGTGEPDTNLFRGMMLSPKLLFGPAGFAIERLDTDGNLGTQPADVFSGWAKWAWIRGNGSGIQAEFRRNTLIRGGTSPWVSEGRREDLMLRGRLAIADGLVAEAFTGWSSFELDTLNRRLGADEARPPKLDQSVAQFGARVSYGNDFVWADLSARGRNRVQFPRFQVDAAGGVRIPPFGEVNGYFTQENWENGAAQSFTARAIAGPLEGVRIFGEVFGGDHGARVIWNEEGAFFTDRSGTRFGAEFNRWGIQLGAALLHVETDSLLTFGMPFDTPAVAFPGGERSGWELAGRVQLYFPWLFADGSVTNWYQADDWIYTPNQLWRIDLELHASPLESGNLEIFGRIGLRHRGAVLMPTLVGDPGSETIEPALFDDYTIVDGQLQIRIRSVRIFIRGDNMLGAEYFEVPDLTGETRPGPRNSRPRIFYGVKWDFQS